MKTIKSIPLLLATVLLSVSSLAQAQGMPVSREQVKMDRAAFLQMFQWNEFDQQWVMKSGMAPPVGITSREEVHAKRDMFLSMNTWSEFDMKWMPVKGEPRVMSKLTRAQVNMEREMFFKTHMFDEMSETWVAKNPATK